MISDPSIPPKAGVKIEEVCEVEIPEPQSKNISTPKTSLAKYASSTRLDWSDNETVSDLSESRNSRHLDSPKRKLRRSNHYTVQSPFKVGRSNNRIFELLLYDFELI